MRMIGRVLSRVILTISIFLLPVNVFYGIFFTGTTIVCCLCPENCKGKNEMKSLKGGDGGKEGCVERLVWGGDGIHHLPSASFWRWSKIFTIFC